MADMNGTLRYLSACGAGLLIATAVIACGSGASGEPAVAQVGQIEITKATLEHWALVEGAVTGETNQNARSEAALTLLIAAEWTIAEAEEAGVTASDAEARRQLARYNSDQSLGTPFTEAAGEIFFADMIGSPGVKGADALWLMKLNVLAFRLQQKRLRDAERAITRAQVARYFAHHRQQFVVPEQRELEVLGNEKKSVVAQAKREIEGGADFLKVAKRVSTDFEAPEGLQRLRHGQEEPAYERHVFAAPPGVLVGPVKQEFYYLFKVLKVIPYHAGTLAQSQAAIRSRIVAGRKEQLAAEWRHADELKWTARTDCRPAHVVAKCRQFPHR
jgi:hypothetical protein